MGIVGLLFTLVSASLWAEEAPLGLKEAEALALAADPAVQQLQAQAAALRERAVSRAQLPDPKLKLGAMNLPVDTFDRSDVPMTQMQVGVQQRFPPGDTLQLRGQQTEARADSLSDRAIDQKLITLRSLREDYLEVLYQVEAGRIIDDARSLFEELLAVSTDYYGTGRSQQQDVFRAELELSRLDDRSTRVTQAEEMARARLAVWIGEAAYRPLSSVWPELDRPQPLAELVAGIERHPRIRFFHKQVLASEIGVDVARENYKPGWMLDVTYGARNGQDLDGTSRPDFLSAMVSIDLPLFRANRQDRELAASSRDVDASTAARQDAYRQLQRAADREWAAYRRLEERLKLFTEHLLPEARDNSRASLAAYQSGVSEFTTLVRARITEYELQLDYARARIDQKIARARLIYLSGDPS